MYELVYDTKNGYVDIIVVGKDEDALQQMVDRPEARVRPYSGRPVHFPRLGARRASNSRGNTVSKLKNKKT